MTKYVLTLGLIVLNFCLCNSSNEKLDILYSLPQRGINCYTDTVYFDVSKESELSLFQDTLFFRKHPIYSFRDIEWYDEVHYFEKGGVKYLYIFPHYMDKVSIYSDDGVVVKSQVNEMIHLYENLDYYSYYDLQRLIDTLNISSPGLWRDKSLSEKYDPLVLAKIDSAKQKLGSLYVESDIYKQIIDTLLAHDLSFFDIEMNLAFLDNPESYIKQYNIGELNLYIVDLDSDYNIIVLFLVNQHRKEILDKLNLSTVRKKYTFKIDSPQALSIITTYLQPGVDEIKVETRYKVDENRFR